ncbi:MULTISPECIES: MaoC family dehydratase N-terminal domain-containing protein [Rhodococcus]|jgi:acyl dehydratase|uniref:MaoC family dehydratase N-terminal domain-containing protein n=1 Tax=Rhodococcus TaxID=1827 RepID=UPI001639683E|nr:MULTISPECIES: MaoC family dehydratase N-terminal domain-containing protein [Rhodococcus]MBC2589702.1 MaoC family dehydratase N-terminal domain-containing protein [Rhodococcus aetherivorans]QRI77320.1 MaoC family dehydratase N-terminal domain-containing protein [Rhodococcus aetherivorans]QSE60740.1 MaoC family dehydratase N-terminal domain-containing protein [Rhodococcus sp. PSBB066]QSE67952.1 MaoC family dehydratase N-terminal domain-containing protein [Rhodococcus sp. PSBB049]
MSLDHAILEVAVPPTIADVERGRIRQFAIAIGEENPIYRDREAAIVAGHPDVLAPPTFLFGLELENSNVFADLAAHGVDLGNVLHGEQRFRYFADVHAGDRVTFESEYVDAYTKAGGALDFLVRRSTVTRDGAVVAELESVSVIKNPGGKK